MTAPSPVDAAPHILELLADLHQRSLDQEALLSKTGKASSSIILSELQDQDPTITTTPANLKKQFDRLMIDKFIALEEEERLLAYIKDMVAEADPTGEMAASGGRSHSPQVDLCIHVLKIWHKLLSGDAVWDVVRLIGRALEAYWRILEGGTT
ncbi:uncharacterized protein BO72DRAFT_492634 [Aspergillus fijiensis CBS 313.89]|uniref:Uncharacterized protein n=1 Tax=Aspergillus fijiensis CBS 313.89 TaxID=1448319 RepID=A0A8G1W363_9EURO|nr:uncharacterized protein BO72DRAFT_492634 [Aspergillus fijiensis CBS 313.89]RAK81211.1 hypothetical protein BO72DRAFT_492634 [Aspergillus fijiensis CBS 313.89]